jgi:hypothetical protein
MPPGLVVRLRTLDVQSLRRNVDALAGFGPGTSTY